MVIEETCPASLESSFWKGAGQIAKPGSELKKLKDRSSHPQLLKRSCYESYHHPDQHLLLNHIPPKETPINLSPETYIMKEKMLI